MDLKDDNKDCWLDITAEFKETVKQLDLGEILKPDSFTLLEAMGAIEMMDPKMDSGMIIKKTNREILSLEQSIKSGKVKVANLELFELLGIIDDTYAGLVTWMDGHHFNHTVMTNLYLHDTEKIEDRCLKVFCQAISKMVEIIDRLVGLVYCIEEEDFMLTNFAFRLATHLNDQKISSALEDLCQQYEKIYQSLDKQNTTTNSSRKQNAEQPDPIAQSADLNKVIDKTKKSHLGALIVRLRFTNNLYACFLNISKNLMNEKFILPGPNPQGQVQKIVKTVQSSALACDQHLDLCLKQIDRWKESLDLGMKADWPDKKTEIAGDYPTIMGFDPLINHKTQVPSYPRIQTVESRPSTLEYLRNFLIRMKNCIRISSHFNLSKSFIKPLEALEHFSKYFVPKSCVISRSFLQTLYLPNRITPLMKEEILQSMNDYCEPVVQLLKADGPKFIALDEFLEECAKLFNLIVATYGHNPARQHEKFIDFIPSFRNLQYSAFLLSESLDNPMVYSWTTYYYMKFCYKYVLSGLELDLFSAHEYPYVFWYLYEILLGNERDQLEMAKRLVVTTCEQTMNSDVLNSYSKHNNKLSKTKVKKRLSKLDAMMEVFHERNLLLNRAHTQLFHGLYILTLCFCDQNIIKMPSREFTSEKTCFDNRFGLITGGLSIHTSYVAARMSLPQLPPAAIYANARECFVQAEKLFERCGDLGAESLAVTRANKIVATILSSNPETLLNRKVEFCFNKHPSLPIIKL